MKHYMIRHNFQHNSTSSFYFDSGSNLHSIIYGIEYLALDGTILSAITNLRTESFIRKSDKSYPCEDSKIIDDKNNEYHVFFRHQRQSRKEENVRIMKYSSYAPQKDII